MQNPPVSREGRNDPAPAIRRHGTAITPRPPSALSLSATISQYFIGGMMPELANPVQQSSTVIEIDNTRGGWQCFERTYYARARETIIGLVPTERR
jgi:hypothetical protein